MIRVRKRDEYAVNTVGTTTSGFGTTTNPPTTTPIQIITGQQTVDGLHVWPLPRRARGVDSGGPFDSTRYTYLSSAPRVDLRNTTIPGGSVWYRYVGLQNARHSMADYKLGSGSPWYQAKPSDDFTLFALGGTAISRCKPTSSVADAAVFLGELKHDGLPDMIGSGLLKRQTRAARFRSVGNEYLNVQFGWRPLMNDLQKFCKSVKDSDTVIRQANRNSGKIVRRRYAFPVSSELLESTVLSTTQSPSPAMPSYLYGNARGTLTRTVTRTKRAWFSGAFTYHLASPETAVGNIVRHAQLADKLIGFLPTPERVWNVSPWSWAADWFVNVGDVLSNMSDMATQGLVMHHGYIMEETIVSVEYSLRGVTAFDGTPLDSTQRYDTVVKCRRVASPFGFGLTFTNFSSWQLSIMAALGMTAKGGRYHSL